MVKQYLLMTHPPSIMRLHLSCRIWIAEMNFDIDILRIFDDYLQELSVKENGSEIKTGIHYFLKQFVDTRKEIDELRDGFHILKMKLAAFSKEKKPLEDNNPEIAHYADIKKRYVIFRKAFNKLKNEFSDFEGKWLD